MFHFARPRLSRHRLRVLIASGLMLTLPFVGVMRVAAAPSMSSIDHGSNSSCATYCAKFNGPAFTTQQNVIKQDEAEAPDPLLPRPDLTPPYFTQFMTFIVPKTIHPASQFNCSQAHPPDTIASLAVFRF